jgi:hypothetical protein
MAEEKKRFPWWLVACAAGLVLLAAMLGFIETVGRQGTIIGRYERLLAPTYLQSLAGDADMEGFDLNMPESAAFAALGPYTDCRDEATAWWLLDRKVQTVRNRFAVLPEEPRLKTKAPYIGGWPGGNWPPSRVMRWEEGPVEVTVVFTRFDRARWFLNYKDLRLNSERFTWWHVRRWAEKAYTAIHGPRH